ncbi:hypothetical protein FACS189437_08530 [Bacteroidia bacterium]|nr:hypothetical protein FACS189437_08530 [Bacteroidia bacterium]
MKIKELFIMAITCLLIVLWINFIDIKIPEIKEGYGEKFEVIVNALCLSFVSAFIFYYVNVYLKENEEKLSFLIYTTNSLTRILAQSRDCLMEMGFVEEKEEDNYPVYRFKEHEIMYQIMQTHTDEDFNKIATIHKNSKNIIKDEIKNLFLLNRFYDVRLRSRLAGILECDFLRINDIKPYLLDNVKRERNTHNKTYFALTLLILDYVVRMNMLTEYVNENLIEYRYKNLHFPTIEGIPNIYKSKHPDGI